MFCWLWWPGVGLNQARGGEGGGYTEGRGEGLPDLFSPTALSFLLLTHRERVDVLEGRGTGNRREGGREREREREGGGVSDRKRGRS